MAVQHEATWSGIIKQFGVSWALNIMIIVGIGYGIRDLSAKIPMVLEAVQQGYATNASDLARSAELFQRTETENRMFIIELINDFKLERVRDQHMMSELIRRGNISSEDVAEAMEETSQEYPDLLKPKE